MRRKQASEEKGQEDQTVGCAAEVEIDRTRVNDYSRSFNIDDSQTQIEVHGWNKQKAIQEASPTHPNQRPLQEASAGKGSQVADQIGFENQIGPRDNHLMKNLVQNNRMPHPQQNYNMQAAYSINNGGQLGMQQSPEQYDPTLVGEHGDYDPYTGMNPIQREEAEAQRKREINEILGMIDEMRMSEDSDSDTSNRKRKPPKKPVPNQNVRGIPPQKNKKQ